MNDTQMEGSLVEVEKSEGSEELESNDNEAEDIEDRDRGPDDVSTSKDKRQKVNISVQSSKEREIVEWGEYIDVDMKALREDVSKNGSQRVFADDGNLNPDLCKFCAIIFDNWEKARSFATTGLWEIHTPYFDTIGGVRQSASQNCSLCAKISSIYQVWKVRTRDRGRGEAGHLVYHNFVSDPGITLFVRHDDSPSSGVNIHINICAELPPTGTKCFALSDPSGGIPLGCLPTSTTVAKAWLSTCRNDHEKCSQKLNSALPTRLIKVNNGHAKLYITKEGDSLKYATLSHCWGTTKFFTLNTNNLAELLEDIPIAKLSKTFRDAIEIVQTLGYEYIWIDSLCIIQDSNEDWKQEAGRMTSVYGNSDLNIAATASPDGNTGCKFERCSNYVRPLRLSVMVNNKQKIMSLTDNDLLRSNIDEAPLSKRAWVLQERFLSPRTLHFATTQLFWECSERLLCETVPFPDLAFSQQLMGSQNRRAEFWKKWSQVVRLYTRVKLTFPTDKALAIAGVAREFAARNSDQYYAGLWRRSFLRDLCWSVTRLRKAYRTLLEPETKIVFPTWSWMSTNDCEISLGLAEYEMETQLIDGWSVNLSYDTDNHFGNLTEATLVLESRRIFNATISAKHNVWHQINVQQIGLRTPFITDVLEAIDEYACVKYIPIGNFKTRKTCAMMALVLGQIIAARGRYRRIGIFKLRCYFKRNMDKQCNIDYCAFCPAVAYLDSLDLKICELIEDQYVSKTINEKGETIYTIEIE